MNTCYLHGCIGQYLSQIGSNQKDQSIYGFKEHARPFWAHNLTWASTLACMHAMCWHAWAHISAICGWIRKMKVFMELGEHTRPIWVHNTTQARKRVCIHAMCLCIGPYLSQIGMDQTYQSTYGIRRTGLTFRAHTSPPAIKLACMHHMCLHAQAHISAKLDRIREIKILRRWQYNI